MQSQNNNDVRQQYQNLTWFVVLTINSDALRSHTKIVHEPESRPRFQCQDCDKTYKMESGLKYHIVTFHEGKKPFTCSLCQKCFVSNTVLKKHIAQVHEKKRPHECQLCHERFGQKAHLVTHIKGKHKGQNVEIK